MLAFEQLGDVASDHRILCLRPTIFTRVSEIGHDRGDTPGACVSQRTQEEQQAAEFVVGGRVLVPAQALDREHVRQLAVARDHDILLCSDECYQEVWFDEPAPSALEACDDGDYTTAGDANSVTDITPLKTSGIRAQAVLLVTADGGLTGARAVFRMSSR